MQVIDCLCCGRALTLPDGLKERGAFACPGCGAALRNVAFTREFRWESQDPYVRKHGASRGNLWGGFAGALVWLVVLAGLMVLRGRFSLSVFVCIALPYLLLLVALRMLRARRPNLVWMMQLWIGLGAYLLYLAALSVLLKDWTDVMKTVADISPALLFALGGGWVATGAIGWWLHAAWVRRLPQATLASGATGSAPGGSGGATTTASATRTH